VISPHLPEDGRPLRVLDVGTGPGLLALCLAEHGHMVTAFDISSGMLKAGKKNAEKNELVIKWTQGDAENLPMQSGSFDLITTKYLFWTLSDPGKFVRECRRVLTDKGILIGIDGPWNQKTIIKSIYSSLFSMFNKNRDNEVENVFEDYYRDIKDKLPLYDRSDVNLISRLYSDAGFKEIHTSTLTMIHSFHKNNAPFSYRIRNPHPPFLIAGKVTA